MRANSFVHVIGYATAVALAVAGTASALPGTNTVNSGDIINGQVKNADLGSSAVKSGKVADNSLRSRDVRDGTLAGADVKDGSLAGADVMDNALTGADVMESSLDFTNAGCKVGMILGAARINGYVSPAAFGTGAWVLSPMNCAGGTVEVRKNGVGSYNVRFNGVTADHVQVTVEQGNVAHSIITAYKEVVSATDTWRVSISDDNGVAEDRYFQIMTY